MERSHLVGGFGKIRWIDRAGLAAPEAEGLAAAEPGIVGHMNEDHGDAVQLYAEKLIGRTAGGWTMTGIDPEGVDLRRRGETARLDFDAPLDVGRRGAQGSGGSGRPGPDRSSSETGRKMIPRRGIHFAVAKPDPHDPRH